MWSDRLFAQYAPENSRSYTLLVCIFAVIGALIVGNFVFSFLRLLFSLLLLPGQRLPKASNKKSWAVVTGASDGLGAEFSRQLARQGYNLVLVSRTASKLENLAEELKAANPTIETATLAMDFSANDHTKYAALHKIVQDLDIYVLVNNVGVSHSIPVTFAETPVEELNAIITVNIIGTLTVTQMIVPKLIQQKSGLILTMASFAGVSPTPLLATYAGSKAFLQAWSTAMGAELEPHGVRVQLVQSYLITSAMSKVRRVTAMIPDPKTFVKAALAKIGRSGGAQGIAYTSTPYWAHGLMHWALLYIVGTSNKIVLGFNKSSHEQIRKRALRKQMREAKNE